MMDKEKIVDYAFEKDEKLNVLAIHPTRPLIAYLINIQRTPKITKGWSGGNESLQGITNGLHSTSLNSSGNSICNNSILNQSSNQNGASTANQSIRIIDYDTRQRCLAKGVYHARPADCVFTINSILCSHADIIKLAVVDRVANIYLYDLAYLINGLSATRIAVIRGPEQDVSPYESIVLVWCPFVPCEDFEDGDGGLRLALATNSKIELFAIDRLQGKTGELHRSDLKGAYKCIQDAHETNIVTLSISPDCSTISAASHDHRVTFYSSDIEDSGQRCLHNWTASITDKSSISKLFFLDDYPKLLADSTMKFWGAAFIGTRSGQMILVNLRNWTVYQRITIHTDSSLTKNFDYKIDSTSRNVVAMNGNQCYIIQIEHNHPTTMRSSKIVKTTKINLHNPIYSFVIKHSTEGELQLFTISAYSLERYTINLSTLANENVVDNPMSNSTTSENPLAPITTAPVIISSGPAPTPRAELGILGLPTTVGPAKLTPTEAQLVCSNNNKLTNQVDVAMMDRLVENLFTKLNTTFHQGLEEFLSDIKCEMNDLNSKVIGLSKEVRKLSQQLQDVTRNTRLNY